MKLRKCWQEGPAKAGPTGDADMANRLLNATAVLGALTLISAPVRAQTPFHLQEATIDQIRGELMAGRVSCRVGTLHCIPVLVKDQVETSDMPTTYGSVLFKQFTPSRDATVVKRLKAAGAIVIGKTNMGELAAGYLGSAFGIVHNAYDPARSPAGSSSGSGVGVAANFAVLAVAEDTGGSIRGPAAHGNAVGL